MLNFIQQTMAAYGYWGIIFLMFTENVVPPIPSEVIMPLAGYIASMREFHFIIVVLAGTLGSTLGTMPLFYLGLRLDPQKSRTWVRQKGKYILLSSHDYDRAMNWFQRFGIAAVIICRFLPGVRSVISIPAGLARMNVLVFSIATFAGTMVWILPLTYAGYILRERYADTEQYLNPVSNGLLLLMFAAWLIRGSIGLYRERHSKN